jgi:hypothetical protein
MELDGKLFLRKPGLKAALPQQIPERDFPVL